MEESRTPRVAWDGTPVGPRVFVPSDSKISNRGATAETIEARAIESARRLEVRARPRNNATDDTEVLEPSANPYPLTDNPDLQQYQPGVQKAGINWLLPLLIIGGFVAATKFKKKKNEVRSK